MYSGSQDEPYPLGAWITLVGAPLRKARMSSTPRSRGCGRQERILPCCRSLIPRMVNPHGLTDDAMILLDVMDLQDRCMVYDEVDQRHWRQEDTPHGRGRRGRGAFIARDVPSMIAEIESDVPLDDRIDESLNL